MKAVKKSSVISRVASKFSDPRNVSKAVEAQKARRRAQAAYEAPANPTEETIGAIWSKLLTIWPNYDLYVVPGADRDDKGDGVRLDDLRGNRGTQFYDVPSSVDITSGPWTVLVWCQTFGVPVANATPA